jgi:ABC-2 type transport system ATP-binding protein
LAAQLAIKTENLVKRYGDLVAVNGLNLQVKSNSIHGFLGPNGAGKTTTIKMLVGLLRPNEGRIFLFGKELRWNDPSMRMRVGYMPELPHFPKHLSAIELLEIYGRLFGMPSHEIKERSAKLLEMVGLKGRAKDKIGKYSKGMQQRLGIAQALINSPELVILDEPSLGLDPVGMVEVRNMIKEIASGGTTVFLSSHLLFELQQVCTHATIINKGMLLKSGSMEEIANSVTGPVQLEVEFQGDMEAVMQKIGILPFVSKVEKSDSKLLISLKTNDDVRAEISREITAAGGVVISINQKGKNLEQIFLELMKESGATS